MKKQITILLLTLLTATLFAQTTTKIYVVKNSAKFLPSELISKQVRDVNGDVCAGLMILSDLTGLSYDSYNGITKKNSEPGKDLLFLQPSERVVEIYKSGYEPLKIILNEYGIHLKSGTTWQIKVTGDKKLDFIPINIITDPKGATVFIDGSNKGTGTTFQVSQGKHKIKITKQGYKTITKTIDVSDNNILFNTKLNSVELVTVTIKSLPTDATIIIDGVEEGTTNDQIFKYPGKYKLKLTKSGFLDVQKEISVTETGNNTFTFNLNKSTVTLILQITPATAKLLINKKSYTNKTNIELAPGRYQIEISKKGYEPKIEQIELTLGNSLTKEYSLIQQTGKLQFKIKPIEAKVTLKQNGATKYNWTGAKLLKNIHVGSYTIEAKANGYKTYTKTIEIKENITEKINVIMEKGSDNQLTYSGKTYHIIQIGSQYWLKENLDVGRMIKSTTDGYQQTDNGIIEKYCYNNDASNCDTYGGLYEWTEAMQYVTTEGTQGICPSGWHIPTYAEMKTLQTYVGNRATKLIDENAKSGFIPTPTKPASLPCLRATVTVIMETSMIWAAELTFGVPRGMAVALTTCT